jgi:hypothetical protein
MINRRRTHLVIPLLALSVILALAPAIYAQERAVGTTATLRVSFGTTPHWTNISGTRVEEIPQAERPGYDVFRVDGGYYAYNNNRWYMSHEDHGDFTAIDDHAVPSELSRVPREHWRSYPSGWEVTASSQGERSGGAVGTLQVSFGSAPHWVSISGTRVEEMPQAERPDYDMFRIDGSYYAYDNDRWYMSREDHGDFTAIDHDAVPSELSRVPREHWHTYPSGWAVGNSDPQTQGSVDMSMSMEVSFGTKPHWTGIHGTHVKEIRQGERPDYDMFHYGSNYYVYNNNRWYTSRQSSGRFTYVEDHSVPSELSKIPRDHWRNYPQGWADQYGSPRSDNHSQQH